MAEKPDPKKKIIMVAKYKCQCGYKWKSKNSSGGSGFCKMCHKDVLPYKYRPAIEKEIQPKPRRMFGEFYCEDCERRWYSGNAWEGKGQQCLQCKNMILPMNLRPLLHRFHNEEDRKPHIQHLCEKCQELGYNCRQYTPVEDADDVSVFSESSSVTESSVSEQDLDEEDLTPVPSDSESVDELLDQLETLDLDN